MRRLIVILMLLIFSISLIGCDDNKDPKPNGNDNTEDRNDYGVALDDEVFE